MVISDSLREQLGVPAWRSGFLSGVMHCRQTEDFMEGLLERLTGEEEQAHQLWGELKARDARMEELNEDIANVGRVTAKCRSCGEYTDVDYDIKDFTRENHYCGRSDRCCP